MGNNIKRKIRKLFEDKMDKFHYYHHLVLARRKGSDYELKHWPVAKDVYISNDCWKRIESLYQGFRFNPGWYAHYKSFWHKMGKENDYDVARIMPSDFFYSYIEPYFSNPIAGLEYSDKNMTDLLFPDVRRPKTVIRFQDGVFMNEAYEIVSRKQAYKMCKDFGNELIIKPSDRSGGGRGITFWNPHEEDYSLFDRLFVSGEYYVVQEVVKQHEMMSKLHSGSLNTMRLMTLIWDGQVLLLPSFVRFGVGDSKVDNAHCGGLFCGIKEDGHLEKYATDFHGNVYKVHPNGCVFDGFEIPSYKKCVDMVKALAPRFMRITKLISWDVAVAENGDPVLIESNLMYSSCEAVQIAGGPIFGDKTEEIVNWIKKNRKKKFVIN